MCFLIACGNVLSIPDKKDSSLLLIENFLYAISSDDIATAEEYIHCDSPLKEGRLEHFLAKAEDINNIDFFSGVEIINTRFDGFSLNESAYKGDVYGYTLKIYLNNKTFDMVFILVDNNQGYGIHSFAIIE